MPTASTDGTDLYYDASGPEDAETVVFVNEAGLGGWLWGWQHAALTGSFRTVVWDLRGTGRSDAPEGPYDLETLVEDLQAIFRAVEARRVHLIGAGLGGAVALVAARRSSRVRSLCLFGTALTGSAFELAELWAPPTDRDALRQSLSRALSPTFVETHPDVVDGIVEWRADGDADEAGFAAQLAALDAYDASEWAYEVTVPTLVVHGTADDLVSPDAGQTLAEAIPKGTYEPLEGSGHLCFVERSRVVNDRLLGRLESHAGK